MEPLYPSVMGALSNTCTVGCLAMSENGCTKMAVLGIVGIGDKIRGREYGEVARATPKQQIVGLNASAMASLFAKRILRIT